MTLLAGVACDDGAALMADTRSFAVGANGVALEQRRKLLQCDEIARPVILGTTGAWVALEELSWPDSDDIEWSGQEFYKRMVIQRAWRAGLPSLDMIDELTNGDLLVATVTPEGTGVLGHMTPRGPSWQRSTASVVAGSLLAGNQPPQPRHRLSDAVVELIAWARDAVGRVEAVVPADGVCTIGYPLLWMSVDSGGINEGVVNR